MLAAQNSNISIIPKEVVLLVFLSKKKLSSSGTQLRSDLLLSILKSFAFSERLSKYEGHTKLLLPASETPEEKHCWVGKVFDCSSLISSQSGHSLCLFIPVLLVWKDFFFFFFYTTLGFCTQSQWMGFFHTSKQFSDITRWVSYNLTHLSDTIYLKIPLDPTG